MIITNKIATITTSFIKKTLSTSDEDLEKIDYGIKVILSNVFKLIILFVSAYFLGILKYTVLSLSVFGLLRTFACGLHANSTLQCIIINYITFFGNVYISIYFPFSNFALYTLFFISIILLLLYAPADTFERPLVSKKLRKSLKIKSLCVAVLLFIISLIIKNSLYKTIIICSIFQESLVITPIFYKIIGKSYRNYDNITL